MHVSARARRLAACLESYELQALSLGQQIKALRFQADVLVALQANLQFGAFHCRICAEDTSVQARCVQRSTCGTCRPGRVCFVSCHDTTR